MFSRSTRRHVNQGTISTGDWSQTTCLPRVMCSRVEGDCNRPGEITSTDESLQILQRHGARGDTLHLKELWPHLTRISKSSAQHLDGNHHLHSVILLFWHGIQTSNQRRNSNAEPASDTTDKTHFDHLVPLTPGSLLLKQREAHKAGCHLFVSKASGTLGFCFLFLKS